MCCFDLVLSELKGGITREGASRRQMQLSPTIPGIDLITIDMVLAICPAFV